MCKVLEAGTGTECAACEFELTVKRMEPEVHVDNSNVTVACGEDVSKLQQLMFSIL